MAVGQLKLAEHTREREVGGEVSAHEGSPQGPEVGGDIAIAVGPLQGAERADVHREELQDEAALTMEFPGAAKHHGERFRKSDGQLSFVNSEGN